MNEIVGGGAWLSHTGEILQQLGFSNSVSFSDVVCFIGNNSFYMIGFFVLRYVGLCVIMMKSLSSFLWVFYFYLLFLIMEVAYPTSVLVVYPLNPSLDG